MQIDPPSDPPRPWWAGVVSGARTVAAQRHFVMPALNGAVGDRLQRLAIPMRLREAGRDISVARVGRLIEHRHLVICVHGLMGDEVVWGEAKGDAPSLLARLSAAGMTPLSVRYNSGRHVSQNGRSLAALLDALVARHGHRFDHLSFVCHSMGGLVVRSAEHCAQQARAQRGEALQGRAPQDATDWLARMDTLVCLGTPHDGAWLERTSSVISDVLSRVATRPTRIISGLMNLRSAGIQDLRLGLLTDADWARRDAAWMRLTDRQSVPLSPGVRYRLAVGTLTADEQAWLGRVFGDGMVAPRSASQVGLGASGVERRVFAGTGHVALMTRPDVHAWLCDRLRDPPGARSTDAPASGKMTR